MCFLSCPDELVSLQNVKTFKDVKGCDDAKQELEEVVEYLKNPTKFTRLGGKLPKVCYDMQPFGNEFTCINSSSNAYNLLKMLFSPGGALGVRSNVGGSSSYVRW